MTVPDVYPGTTVYVNLLDLKNPDQLEKAEAFFSAKRGQEFFSSPDKAVVVPAHSRFSLTHLQAIHRHLLQDIYSWVGEFRSFPMRKGFHREFSHPNDIKPFADSIQSSIKEDKVLFDGEINQASKRLGHYMSLVNILHPFPEGNGRTQRAFIWLLAQDAGYQLSWEKVTKHQIHAAAIRVMSDSDIEGMENLIRQVIEAR